MHVDAFGKRNVENLSVSTTSANSGTAGKSGLKVAYKYPQMHSTAKGCVSDTALSLYSQKHQGPLLHAVRHIDFQITAHHGLVDDTGRKWGALNWLRLIRGKSRTCCARRVWCGAMNCNGGDAGLLFVLHCTQMYRYLVMAYVGACPSLSS